MVRREHTRYPRAVSTSVPLKCRCGKIHGSIEPAGTDGGRRVVCMCIDCQTYARWLGDHETILDEIGGTEIYQTTPARVHIHQGRDQIRCARLSPKGTFRFYAGCCRTPLANAVPSPGVPFVGVVTSFIDHEASDTSPDRALGPLTVRLNARCATGPAPRGSHDTVPTTFLLGTALGFVWDRLTGQHRPNPFRNDDGSPVHAPEVLTKEERERLRSQSGPAGSQA